METKEYILTNATQFLNIQGFNTTSLRQLAAYLDMSDGNLRYHFKNKEALILAIFFQMVQEMETTNELQKSTSETLLEDLRRQLRGSFFTMYRYKFLFLEASLLFKQFKGFRKAFLKLITARNDYAFQLFTTYQAVGLFRNQHSKTYYEMLLQQFFIIADNWIRYVELEQTSPSSIDKKIEQYIDLCMALLEKEISNG